ncbi:exodeoxyribonuclease VII small subunit [Salipaludibacillus agaradhaerens]|uniref:Exodeoxyribonuclease 7 small subunit n=1 Tax=Salipaludibacillus agaradhaerens TaxID=76935 RepID=A0A9Q4FZE3_SALAG|nr:MULTISPECIES: exodeoxyribonuclease VII small subunit [Salipaludibacillus]UJW57565.1 exodeoxyribonuclease VII small subunit [Bacillus sp. A116_S68]MCR6096664.1 exodeoxyribonuclease VII small subunit [Salipaludibacillus agaradhaerens]MCR6106430.1 exodeoxyribonuclease VII small subunit [Salipaludibacillus agaradhaerens]MCR6113777.1 exodeoxyribonuclease VII small subunit [Salipaludibacillus agaradhaerens]MCR6118463.1 exodeoxyribonuclease VII small subunit [Salipaludibacillus agaradhaerens]
MAKNNESHTFEESMEALENLVEKLEKGDVPLEEAITMFQEGMTLSKECHDRLQKVEKQMAEVLSEDGEISNFQVEEES